MKSEFYFVHTPRCGGRTIFKQLPLEYVQEFDGEFGINQLKKREAIIADRHLKKLPVRAIIDQPNAVYTSYPNCSSEFENYDGESGSLDLSRYPSVNRVSLDHLTLTEAYNIKLINDEDIKNKDFIVIWRNPMHRFISTCNHLSTKRLTIFPRTLIKRLKDYNRDPTTKSLLGRKSWYMTTSDILKLNGKKVDTINFFFKDFASISNHFIKYGVKIKDIHLNKSKRNRSKSQKDTEDKARSGDREAALACGRSPSRLFTINDLNKDEVKFIKDFYKEDFLMLDSMKKTQ